MKKFFSALRVVLLAPPLAGLVGIVAASALVFLAWLSWNPHRSPTVGTLSIVTDKEFFLADESPEFFVQAENEPTARPLSFFSAASAYAESIGVDVLDAYGRRLSLQPILVTTDNGYNISIPSETMPRPGKYTLVARIEKNKKIYSTQKDFRWGVLAINTDKSVYQPKEAAHVSLAVLNDYGQMICDAEVTVAITDPEGATTELKTSDQTITVSSQCETYGMTSQPDYYAKYVTGKTGTYIMELTAKTSNGVRTVYDAFTVRQDIDFDLQRQGPTRIYPELKYRMGLTIKANKNYAGQITEYVPASFLISPQRGMSIVEHKNLKELRWQVRLVKGRTYNYGYEFDAPDVSPALYLMGILQIGDFAEGRFWQIAADAKTLSTVSMTAPTGAQSIAVGGTFTITCDPACTGSGPSPDVVDNYQYSTVSNCGSGNTNIDTSALTADVISVSTNPETATNCGSTSDTITGRNAGTVYISCYSTEDVRTARSSECISVTVTANPTVNQNHYRWRDDLEAESGTTWQNNNEDTATTSVRANRVKRLRLEAANTGSGSANSYTYRLQYGTNSDCTTGSWTQLTSVSSCGASDLFCMAQSQLTDTNATTNINPGLTDTGAFTAGEQVESDSDTAAITVAASAFTENEYAIKVNTSTPENTTYYFRMSNVSTALDAYGSCAQLKTGTAKLTQLHYRWRDDLEAESGTTWQGNNEDTATSSVGVGKVIRLRLEVALTERASSSQQYLLQYGTSASPTGDAWDAIPASGSCGGAPFCMNASSLTEDAATTNINPGLTDGNTTFVAGAQKETNATTTFISLDTTKFTELEYAFQVTPTAIAGQTYYFRLATSTSTGVPSQLGAYSVTPQLTVTTAGIALIQMKTCTHVYLAPATSITCTLNPAATANNLLVTGVSSDKSAGAYTVPTDFTLVHDYVSANVSGAMAYKVAAGGETSITWNYTTSEESSAWVGEYSGLASASVEDVKQENDSGVSAVTSLSTGTTAATSQADELAVVMMAVDTPANVVDGRSWLNSFYEVALVGNTDPTSGTGGLSVATKVLSSTGTQESTYASSDTGDQMYAVITTFKTPSASGAFDAYASSTMSFDASLPVQFISQTSTITKFGALKIVDDRGTSAGWTLNLTGNDWKTTTEAVQMDYNGSGADGNLGKLCANPVGGTLYAESGSLTNVTKGSYGCFSAGVSTIDVVTASNGFGNGTYWLTDMSLGQYIPSNPTAAVYTTTVILTLQ